MAMTNAERQAAYKERMREAGYEQRTFWMTADPIGRLRRLHEELLNRDPTMSAAAALDIVTARLGQVLADIEGKTNA